MKKLAVLFVVFAILCGCQNQKKEVRASQDSIEYQDIFDYFDISKKEVRTLMNENHKKVYCFKSMSVDGFDTNADSYLQYLENLGFKMTLTDGIIRKLYTFEDYNQTIKIYFVYNVEAWKEAQDEFAIEDENVIYEVNTNQENDFTQQDKEPIAYKDMFTYLNISKKTVRTLTNTTNKQVYCFKTSLDYFDKVDSYMYYLEGLGFNATSTDGTVISAYTFTDQHTTIKIYLISDVEAWKKVQDEFDLHDENIIYEVE